MSQHRWRGCDRYTVSNLSRSSTTCLGSCYIPLTLIVQQRCVNIYICIHAINMQRKQVLWTHGIFVFRCPTTFRSHVTDDKPRSATLSRAMGSKPCAKFVLCPEKITQRQWTREFQRSLCRRGFTHKMLGKDWSLPSPPAGKVTLCSLLSCSPYLPWTKDAQRGQAETKGTSGDIPALSPLSPNSAIYQGWARKPLFLEPREGGQ